MAGRFDFEQREKTSLKKLFTYQDKNKQAVDVTSYTATFIVKAGFGDTSPALLTATQANYITLGGVAGTIRIAIPDVNMTLTPGVYNYILYLGDPVTGQEDFLEGQITVTEGLL